MTTTYHHIARHFVVIIIIIAMNIIAVHDIITMNINNREPCTWRAETNNRSVEHTRVQENQQVAPVTGSTISLLASFY